MIDTTRSSVMQVSLPAEQEPTKRFRTPPPQPPLEPFTVLTLPFRAGTLDGPASVVDAVDAAFVGRLDLLALLKEGDNVIAWCNSREELVAAEAPIGARRMRIGRYVGAVRGWFDELGSGMDGAFRARPVDASRITSRYGARFHPVDKRTSVHRGTDYGAPTGTPVKVTAPGRVAARGFDAAAGNNLRVQHAGGAETAYLHLSAFGEQRVGDLVPAGAVIGFVGSTGKSTGPHLHYELRYAGVSVDSPAMISEGRTALGPAELHAHREFLASLPQPQGVAR